MSLAAALREATRDAHLRAEQHPFIRALFAGRLDAADYMRMLASLEPVYDALEQRVQQLAAAHDAPAWITRLPWQALARAAALRHDLRELHAAGIDGSHTPCAPGRSAQALAARVQGCEPRVLAAHAYVRYLGDLSGGQMMRSLLVPMLGHPLADRAARFHEFGDAAQVRRLSQAVRAALDAAGTIGTQAPDPAGEAIVAEARLAFDLHGALFDELQAARQVLPQD